MENKTKESVLAFAKTLSCLTNKGLSLTGEYLETIKDVSKDEKGVEANAVFMSGLGAFFKYTLALPGNYMLPKDLEMAKEGIDEIFNGERLVEMSYDRILKTNWAESLPPSLIPAKTIQEIIRAALFEVFCDDPTVLDETEQKAIQLFNGLKGTPIKSIDYISNETGLTFEKIRQTKERAQQKVLRKGRQLGIKF